MHSAPALVLQPLNATVSIVDQAYTALKEAIWLRTSTRSERKFVSTSVN